VPRGGVALDVGMHKGGYSWCMARRVGLSGQVFGFEPQLRVVEPTARALARVGLRQVRVIHAALSDRSGEAMIAMRRSSTHGASLEGLDGASENSRTEIEHALVPLLSLDDFAARERLTRLDFVKIDVEGHELAVLRGGLSTFARLRPALLVEIEVRHHGVKTDPVYESRALLEPLGYSGEFFTRSGREPIAAFRAEVHQRYGEGYYSNNFLFTRDHRRR